MRYIISVVLGIIFICAFIVVNGGYNILIAFLDMPALTFILLPTIAVLYGSGQLKDFIIAFKIIGKRDEVQRLSAIRSARGAIRTAMLTSVAAGSAGFFICCIVIGYNMTDTTYTIGLSFAVAALTVFYASVVPLFLLPVFGRLHKMELDYISTEAEAE